MEFIMGRPLTLPDAVLMQTETNKDYVKKKRVGSAKKALALYGKLYKIQ